MPGIQSDEKQKVNSLLLLLILLINSNPVKIIFQCTPILPIPPELTEVKVSMEEEGCSAH